MTNVLEAEVISDESLKFAEIRSIEKPLNGSMNGIRDEALCENKSVEFSKNRFELNSVRSKNKLPPPLLPKPKLTLVKSSNLLNKNTTNENETKPFDIKKTIEQLNKFGPKLFEPVVRKYSIFNLSLEKDLEHSPFHLLSKCDETKENGEPAVGYISTQSSNDLETDAETLSIGESDHDTLSSSNLELRQGSDVQDFKPLIPNQSDTLHMTILLEMFNKGFFKKLAAINHFSGDIGKTQKLGQKINRQPCTCEPPSFNDTGLLQSPNSQSNIKDGLNVQNVFLRNAANNRNTLNTVSVDSSMSASTFSDHDSEFSVFFNTGDEEEDKRLKNLYNIAREFYFMQKTYVELLHQIAENYVKFLNECSSRCGKVLLNNTCNCAPHVIIRIASHLKQILGVHKILLDDFAEKYSKWDSQNPDLASILQKKAEFLKICSSFLKEKRSLSAELQQALDENKDLAYATKQFEDNVLNSPSHSCLMSGSAMSLRGISIVMHLDAVHQNVVRYRLLMERYRKYLPDDLAETKITEEALSKLIVVSNTVNGFLANADAEKKLLHLHRKLEDVFDVFAPGRSLIYEGELQRQTRKDLQLRYLILFSDTLLICRYSSLGSDNFETSRLYKIVIDRVCVQIQEHDDYEREFVVISPKMSSAFVAKSKLERDTWVKRINETRRDFCEKKKKRRSFVQQRKNSINNSCEESPETECRTFAENGLSRQQSTQSRKVSCPKTTTVHNNNEKNFRVSNRYEAVWIPDNKATKCLMTGCNTKFNMLKRKHHCRQCGWLICRNCVGYAPVKIKNFKHVKVCPECYYSNCTAFQEGRLFPASWIQRVNSECIISAPPSVDIAEMALPADESKNSSNQQLNHCALNDFDKTKSDLETAKTKSQLQTLSIEDPSLRIVYDGGLKLEMPKDLFIAPPNGFLKKTKIPAQNDGELFLVSGKVLMKNKKGVEVQRWARLTKDMMLQFYKAEFDNQPLQSYFVYGYSLTTTELNDGGQIIELFHLNQFKTDRKEHRVVFQVLHSKSAKKWLESLRNCISAFNEEL